MQPAAARIVEILFYFIIHIAHCIDEKEMYSAMKFLRIQHFNAKYMKMHFVVTLSSYLF